MATPKIAQDFKLVNNDLYIDPKTGDFVIAPSDNQHIQDILEYDPGWQKEFPQVGAAIRKLLKAKLNVQKTENIMKQQLESDGYQVGRPSVSIDANGSAIIDPKATRIKF